MPPLSERAQGHAVVPDARLRKEGGEGRSGRRVRGGAATLRCGAAVGQSKPLALIGETAHDMGGGRIVHAERTWRYGMASCMLAWNESAVTGHMHAWSASSLQENRSTGGRQRQQVVSGLVHSGLAGAGGWRAAGQGGGLNRLVGTHLARSLGSVSRAIFRHTGKQCWK